PLFILSMARDIAMTNMSPEWLLWSGWTVIFFLLATPVQVIVGGPYLVGAWKALKNRTANMDTLIAMGSSVAYVYSVIVLLGQIFGVQGIREMVYFETAAVILTLITLGKLLEARAKGQTSEAIKKLMGLAPRTALLLRGDEEVEVA